LVDLLPRFVCKVYLHSYTGSAAMVHSLTKLPKVFLC